MSPVSVACDALTGRFGADGASVGGATGAVFASGFGSVVCGVGIAPDSISFYKSFRVIRPPAPVPVTCSRSMPCSPDSFKTAGE